MSRAIAHLLEMPVRDALREAGAYALVTTVLALPLLAMVWRG